MSSQEMMNAKSESTRIHEKDTNDSSVTNLTKMLVTSAAALITIIGLRMIAQDLISPILLAVFLTVLMYPIFKLFRRTGRSSTVSLILMILTLIIGFVLFGLFLTFTFNELSNSLSVYLDDFYANLDSFMASIQSTVDVEQYTDPNMIKESLSKILSEDKILSLVQTIIGSLGNLLYYLVFIPFIAILMLLQLDAMPQKLTKDLANQSPMVKKFQKFADTIIVYIIARGKVNAFTGFLFAIALALIGVEFAILWGILVAILSFIPYLGIVIASIPPVLIAFATGGWVAAVAVIIAVIIVNVLAENVIDPYVQGQSNKISAVTIILALIFWTWLLGPVGALLSVPLTVLLKLILEDYTETRWIAKIMEGNFAESAEEINKRNIVQKVTDRFTNKEKNGNG